MTRHCPQCGEKITGSPKFCISCGYTFKGSNSASNNSMIFEDQHTKSLQKGYLIFGIFSVIIPVFLMICKYYW